MRAISIARASIRINANKKWSTFINEAQHDFLCGFPPLFSLLSAVATVGCIANQKPGLKVLVQNPDKQPSGIMANNSEVVSSQTKALSFGKRDWLGQIAPKLNSTMSFFCSRREAKDAPTKRGSCVCSRLLDAQKIQVCVLELGA